MNPIYRSNNVLSIKIGDNLFTISSSFLIEGRKAVIFIIISLEIRTEASRDII
jgi:NADH:ubiquinone oxidoreductase subunit K